MKSKGKVDDLSLYVNRGISPEYTESFQDSITVINQKCIRDYKINLTPARLHDLAKRKISVGKTLKKYDVLINSTGVGTLGRVAQFFEDCFSATVDSHITIVRPNAEKVDPVYFGYLIKSKQKIIESFAEGTTGQTELARDSVKELEIEFVNNKLIQKKIGEFLLSIDEKLDVNQKINQTLEQIAQAIFKSWFVDFEPTKAKIAALEAGGSIEDATLAAMTVISGKSTDELAQMRLENSQGYDELRNTANLFPSALVESELGLIPDGLEVKGLDEIANYLNGLALQKFRPENENEYLPVLKISQLKKGIPDSEEKASLNIKPEYIVNDGDVIFSWSGSLMVEIWCGGKAALNQHLFKVTSDFYPKWLFYLFTRHHLTEFQRIAAAKAVTMGHIKREHLTGALCAVPALGNSFLQRADVILGNNIKQQIELRLECKTLAQIRDNLLPKLLSGEINSHFHEARLK